MRLGPILALFLALATAPAFGQEGPRLSLAAVEASRVLQLSLAEMAASKTPLAIGQPPVAEPFGRIFNTKELLALPPVAAKDVPWLVEWLSASTAVYWQLLMFGSPPNAGPQDTVVIENLRGNEDQISVALEFMLLLLPRTVDAATAFFQTLPEAERNSPVRQGGLARMRAGYMQTVAGGTTYIGGMPKPENARLVAAALRSTVNDWGKLSNATQRAELLTLLADARNRSSDAKVQEDLLAVSSALAAVK